MIDAKDVQFSVSICKINGTLDQADEKSPIDVPIEFIDQIKVSGPNTSLNLFSGNESYTTIAILDKVFLCKEFPIPDAKVNKIRIIHRLYVEYGREDGKDTVLEYGKEMKVYVHMQGAFLLDQFLEEIDKEILKLPFSEFHLKMENYDLSKGLECMGGDQAYDECIIRDTLQFLNDTVGCSLPLRRLKFEFLYFS